MKVLILTNGEYGDYGFCKKAKTYDRIICADGGMRHAKKLGLVPDLILGDFDSGSEEDLAFFKEQGVMIETFNAEKDETDTELAVRRALEMGATELTLYGGIGSRLDHTLANVHLLYKLLTKSVKGKIVHPQNTVYLINSSFEIKGNPGDLISLIPFAGDAKGVSTKKLAYPLYRATLTVGSTLGVSNYMLSDSAKVSVEEGMLLVILARD